MTEQTCKTCRFCEPFGEKDRGYCRRNPPVYLPDRQHDEDNADWPKVVLRYDWCGEYQPKPEKNNGLLCPYCRATDGHLPGCSHHDDLKAAQYDEIPRDKVDPFKGEY